MLDVFTAASPSDERQGSVAEFIVLQQETAEGLSAAASLDRSCRSIRLAAEGSSIVVVSSVGRYISCPVGE